MFEETAENFIATRIKREGELLNRHSPESDKAAFEKMASAKSNEAFAEADIEFHRNIFRATHNEFFWPIAQMFELARAALPEHL